MAAVGHSCGGFGDRGKRLGGPRRRGGIAVGEGRWHGMVPDRRGGPPGVWPFGTPLGRGRWRELAGVLPPHRPAEESARAVTALRVEEESDPAVWSRLFFNLTFVGEAESNSGPHPTAAGRKHTN